MPIRVLEPELIAKIAAGEVVEDPSSVVKELVENSLDAGAHHIWIVIEGGGLSLIQVRDDGCGIPHDEAQTAFQRHATSKLPSKNALDDISSLGFRGEALPSIATVSETEMLTRTETEELGTYLRLKDGATVLLERRPAPAGTTVIVRNLFEGIPARRKFMPTAHTLSGRISHLVSRMAMGSPGTRSSLISDGRRSFASEGTGSLRDVAAKVYGAQAARAMLELDAGGVSGIISPPSLSRANRGHVSLYVNGRWIQNRALTAAVEGAYHGLLMTGRFPIAAIQLRVPAGEVDVNVHPAKREVRLLKERELFGELQRAIRSKLLEESPVAELAPAWAPSLTPLTDGQAPALPAIPDQALPLWSPQQNPSPPTASGPSHSSEWMPAMRVVGQLSSTYIVAEGPDGMYMVDQHAAHERVLFERILQELEAGACESQGLLEPIVAELSPLQRQALKDNAEGVRSFGFEMEPFGEDAALIRSIPAILNAQEAAEALADILEQMAEETTAGSWRERVAASLACHGAIKAAHPLHLEEMRQLMLQLERAANPKTCPHGRPTTLYLSSSLLERQFGRR